MLLAVLLYIFNFIRIISLHLIKNLGKKPILLGWIFSIIWYIQNLIFAVTQTPYRQKPIRAAFYRLMDPERDYYRQQKMGLPRVRVKELEDIFYVENGVQNYLLTRGNSPRFIEAGKKARRIIWRFFNTDTGDCCPQHIRALHAYFTECHTILLKLKPLIQHLPYYLKVKVDENQNPLPEAKHFDFDNLLNIAIKGAEYCVLVFDAIDSVPGKRPSMTQLEKLVHQMTNMYHCASKLEPILQYMVLPPNTPIEGYSEIDIMIHFLELQFILEDTFTTIIITI